MDILRQNSGPRREATAESGLPQGSAAGQRGGGAAQAARAKQAPYLRDRFPGKSMPSQIRQAIENYQKTNPGK